jgi:hypothetical protein
MFSYFVSFLHPSSEVRGMQEFSCIIQHVITTAFSKGFNLYHHPKMFVCSDSDLESCCVFDVIEGLYFFMCKI